MAFDISNEFRQILDNSGSGYAFLSPDYVVEWENLSKVFGHLDVTQVYQAGRKCFRDAFSRDSPCEHCIMRDAIESGKPETVKFAYENGLVADIMATPVYDDNNKLYGVVLKYTDVTESERIQAELRTALKQMRRYSALLEMSIQDNDIYTWSYNIDDDYFSDDEESLSLRKKYGWDSNVRFGLEEFLKFINQDHRQIFIDKFHDLIKTGNKQSIDCQMLVSHKNQERYEWFRYKSSFLIENGKRLMIGTSQCIEDFVRERDLLKELLSDAEKNTEKSFAFLSNMSHEIRNPVNVIVGFANLLAEAKKEEERLECVKMINTHSEILLNLVNEVLDLSKIGAGTVIIKSEKIDLAPFFDEFMESLRIQLKNPDIQFIIENPYVSCIIEADKNRLAQVVTNYVTNAFKYTEKGSVTVGYEYVNRGLRLYVTDTGIGIPKDKQDKVFGRFEKFDTFAAGNGLGLSIVKGLVEAVGGKVGFTSEEGVGSTFWAWKPCVAEIIKRK